MELATEIKYSVKIPHLNFQTVWDFDKQDGRLLRIFWWSKKRYKKKKKKKDL